MSDKKNYLVTKKSGSESLIMKNEVEALIHKEGREKDVFVKDFLKGVGIVLLACDEAFAEKVKSLPSVASVEAEKFTSTPKPVRQKPRGPGGSF